MSENTQVQGSAGDVERSLRVVQHGLEKLLETGDVRRVFGDPVEKGEVTLIPTAEIISIVGYGAGAGGGTSADEDEGQQAGSGGGGGGGGKTFSRPVAVVVATPEAVRVEPVVDLTKIWLAAITAAGFMLAVALRMLKPKEALRELKGD